MINDIIYENLALCPQFVDDVAKYWHAEWSSDKSVSGLAKKRQSIVSKLNINKVPFIFVAHNSQQFVGSVALFEYDLDLKRDFSPWISGVYTVPEYRGKGVAKTLIHKILLQAKKLGYNKIYLHTEHTADLYTKLGWIKLCDCFNDRGEPSEIYTITL